LGNKRKRKNTRGHLIVVRTCSRSIRASPYVLRYVLESILRNGLVRQYTVDYTVSRGGIEEQGIANWRCKTVKYSAGSIQGSTQGQSDIVNRISPNQQ